MPQELKFNDDASSKIKAGVDKLADAVKVTLGPKGRNVIIQKQGVTPHITKDGVTVAQSITLEDPVENMGAQLVKDVASKTAYEAGDGTTTATILAQAIYSAGLKNIAAGANAMELKRGIDEAVKRIVKEIGKTATPVAGDQLLQVATISANGDAEIARIVVEAVTAVGEEGVVTIEEGAGFHTEVKVMEGLQFDSGYTDPRFVNSPGSGTVEFDNPLFLVYDGKLQFMKQMQKVLEQILLVKRPLVIICDDIDGEALKTLVINHMKEKIKVATVRAPYHGDRKTQMLQDIAASTGATLITDDAGMRIEDATLELLGSAERVTIERTRTLIVNGIGNVDNYMDNLRERIKNTDEDHMIEWFKLRLSRLLGGVAAIKVGAASQVEMMEIKDRIDDALQATRAAMAEGILAGGGSTLARLGFVLSGDKTDFGTGISVIKTATQAPLRAIAENAGKNPDTILERTVRGGKGWNARSDKWGDLLEMGVIDPAKVTRLALENAASVAGLLLTTRCVVYEKPHSL